jgi:hypothetical protein
MRKIIFLNKIIRLYEIPINKNPSLLTIKIKIKIKIEAN